MFAVEDEPAAAIANGIVKGFFILLDIYFTITLFSYYKHPDYFVPKRAEIDANYGRGHDQGYNANNVYVVDYSKYNQNRLVKITQQLNILLFSIKIEIRT